MENKLIKEKLIEKYGSVLVGETQAFRLQASTEESFLKVDSTQIYVVDDYFTEEHAQTPHVDKLLKVFTNLCWQASIFVNEESTQADYVGEHGDKFGFLKVPMRGVVVAIALLPRAESHSEVELVTKHSRSFAIVHVFRDDTEIQSQGNEFVSQTLNMETGQVHTCLFRMGVTADQPLFPAYVPVMVCPKGYNNPQDAVDNQAEDLQNMIPVASFQ